MTRRARVGAVLAILFALINLAGMVYAAIMGEVLHTAVHGVLLVLVAFVVWRLTPRRVASQGVSSGSGSTY